MDITDARLVGDLARDLRYGRSSLDDVPRMLRELLERDCWREFTSLTGKAMRHDSWASFVTTIPAGGLGTSVEAVDRMAGRDPEVLALLKRAKAGRGRGSAGRGRPSLGPDESSGPNDAPVDEDDAARLQRDRPDLLAEVSAGAKSLHAAAVEAGYRKRRVSVRTDSADSAAATLRRALPPDVRQRLAALLLEDV